MQDVQVRRFRQRLDSRVAKRFRRPDQDQQFLLPVDMREWLPDDHVVWALLGVVDRLDVSCGARLFDLVPPENSIASLTCPFRLRGWCGAGWLARCCSRSSVC
jgi:hypothetical protein